MMPAAMELIVTFIRGLCQMNEYRQMITTETPIFIQKFPQVTPNVKNQHKAGRRTAPATNG